MSSTPVPKKTAAPAPEKVTSTAPPSPVVALPLFLLIAAGVGLIALGLGIGTAGAFLQARTWGGGLRLPVGAIFCVAALGAAAVSAGHLLRSRLGVAAIAFGWVISVLVFTSGRPEGDVIIAADLPGYGYLVGGMVVLGIASAVPVGAAAPSGAA